jgi:hypothetical protein
MSVGLTHRMVGYDRGTGRVVVEYPIPDRLLDHARQVAGVGDDDPQAVLCYELNPGSAREITGAIGVDVEPEDLTFFLGGFATSQ